MERRLQIPFPSTYAAQAEGYGATVTGVDDLNQTIELLLSKPYCGNT